ncbi:hypothetical protein K144312032_04130 [Clostridium tetani]|uniref:DUF4358 domain-containing protein n=1 Tax=Clostridium tetani TaxID=1513 RepID=UPI002955D496|nr:DUF4358 domain-containing protein [Clostridium tetani]BDR66185.1 hypothetical protein K144312032_04130 [Clostridium tetani]
MFNMKNFKKILMPLLVISFMVATFTGCSKSSDAKNVSIKEIGTKIEKEVDLSDMNSGDETKLEKLYKIKSDDIEEFFLYVPKSNIKASEIAIVKVKDAKKVEDFKKNFTERLDKQSSSFKDYLPDEYFLIEKNVLKTKDNYIFFTISKDVDKVEKIFDESFK